MVRNQLEVLLLTCSLGQSDQESLTAAKNWVATNLEQSLDGLKAACEQFFDQLSPDEALRKAGLSTR